MRKAIGKNHALDDIAPSATRLNAPRRRAKPSTGDGKRSKSTVYGPPSTADGPRSTADGAPLTPNTRTRRPAAAREQRWEAENKRLTFHCPKFLEDLIEEAMRASGRSKSRVIVDALKQHLRVD